jgi:thiol-disulfide isomerase/thioredoxin
MKVLKFGAEWCTVCLVMKPRWEKIEKTCDWLKTEFYDANEDRD